MSKENLINEVLQGKQVSWYNLAVKHNIRPEGTKEQRRKAANDIWRTYLKNKVNVETKINFVPRRLFLDIETSYHIVKAWRIGNRIHLNYDDIIQEKKVICVGLKWSGEESVTILNWSKGDDKLLITQLMDYINEADEIVGHNIDEFDLPLIFTQAVKYGLKILPRYKTTDTLKLARRYYKFPNNKLDTIAQYLGVGSKVEHRGIEMWDDIILRYDPFALDEMGNYCAGDVLLTERVFNRISSCCASATNHAVANGFAKHVCPECGHIEANLMKTNITTAGTITRTLKCNNCDTIYVVNNVSFRKYYGE